jgi:hypothetical protein
MNSRRLIGSLGFAVLGLALLAGPPLAANMDGVMMSGGKMMMMHMGKPTGPMDHRMTMANGTTVAPDGTVRMEDGTVIHLKNGQMVMMDGHIMRGAKATAMHR